MSTIFDHLTNAKILRVFDDKRSKSPVIDTLCLRLEGWSKNPSVKTQSIKLRVQFALQTLTRTTITTIINLL